MSKDKVCSNGWFGTRTSSALSDKTLSFEYCIGWLQEYTDFFDDLDQPAKAFTVTINAATGEVIKTYTPDSVSE